MKKTEKGKNFENYVASLYTAIGYSVRTNVSLNNQQIDILAEKSTGEAGMFRLAIECKYLESGSVKNQDIFDFNNVISTLKSSDGITKGVLITNASFSKDASGAANKLSHIELLTIKKLEDSLFELTTIYKLFKDRYEANSIFQEYIPSKGIVNGNKFVENVESKIYEWVKEPQMHFLTIFGDYGTGKTTLLERVKYNYIIKYLEGESVIKPIIIYLKDFQKYQTLDNLLYHSILKEFNREIPLELFYMAIEKGSILLLLDGFDEMVQQIDKQKRKENFFTLTRLLPANAIITCRPAYFISLEEYCVYLDEIRSKEGPINLSVRRERARKSSDNKHLYEALNKHLHDNIVNRKPVGDIEFFTIDLKEFDQSQIDIYLQKSNKKYLEKYNQDWREIKQLLLSIYDIKDLMRRPILLKMIVTTILFDKFDLTKNIMNIGPSSLYDSYTSHYLEIEWNKGESRQLLSSTERAKFAMAIAVTMFINGKLEVSHHEIVDVINQNTSIGEIERKIKSNSIENIASDIRLCVFLTVSSDNTFKFVHKSFMEFYVAKFLRDLILNDDMNDIFDILFTKEILYFLCSFCLVNEDLKIGILRWHKKETDWYFAEVSDNFKRNISCALILSGTELKNLSFSSLSVSYIQISKRIFDRCRLEEVVFDEAEIEESNFSNCAIKNVSFKKSLLKNVLMSGKNIKLDLFESEFHDCEITCEGMSITSLESKIVGSKFISAEIVVGGNIKFNDCQFSDGGFQFDTNFSTLGIEFKGAAFHRCFLSLENFHYKKIDFYRCTFADSEIQGLVFQQIEYSDASFKNCTGYILIQEFYSSDNIILGKLKKRKISENYLLIGQLIIIYEPAWRRDKKAIVDNIERHHIEKKWIEEFIVRQRSIEEN